MIALILSPLYIACHVWIIVMMLKWMRDTHPILGHLGIRIFATVIYSSLALSIVGGFLLKRTSVGRILTVIGNNSLGALLYLLLSLGVVGLIWLLLKHLPNGQAVLDSRVFRFLAGVFCIVVTLAVCLIGTRNAADIQTTRYDVRLEKSGGALEKLDVVLAADLHLGYNIGCDMMRLMVDKINAENPDLVILAGDIFDNDFDALEDPEELAGILRGIQSRYGVYACWGNHDVQEKILAGFTFSSNDAPKTRDERMDQFLIDANVRCLNDEYELIDNSFYLYGRPDLSIFKKNHAERAAPEELVASMDPSLPIFVIDHEPGELDELAQAGVDVDFSGHTHDGQLFPGNLLIDVFWENACGYEMRDGLHSIVTSGVGLFGPNMRVGTDAEICAVHISFAE